MKKTMHKYALPCPFCRADQTDLVELDKHLWVVVCKICGASGPIETIPAKAREHWDKLSDLLGMDQ